MQLKRRSLLRSAGTASSPDLATLVRKAKAKAAAAAGMNGGGGQTEEVKNNNRQNEQSRNTLSPNSAASVFADSTKVLHDRERLVEPQREADERLKRGEKLDAEYFSGI